MDDEPKITISGRANPFLAPAAQRDPSRRLRGRLAAPVTIWTAGTTAEDAGLTVSSLMVAEGVPAHVIGLLSDTTELYEALTRTGRFVVHVLETGHAHLADRFARLTPFPGGLYEGLDVAESEHGPVLGAVSTLAHCAVGDVRTVGYSEVVSGPIERVTVDERTVDPLVYFHGRYRRLGPRHGA